MIPKAFGPGITLFLTWFAVQDSGFLGLGWFGIALLMLAVAAPLTWAMIPVRRADGLAKRQ